MIDHEFITARFTDNEKTIIEALWRSEDGMTVAEYVEAKEGDLTFDHLLTVVTLEQIHEFTYKHVKEERANFESMVMGIALKENLIEAQVKTDTMTIFLDLLLAPETDKEFLFKLKLSLFNLDIVKNSKDRGAKGALRKAQTTAAACAAYSKF